MLKKNQRKVRKKEIKGVSKKLDKKINKTNSDISIYLREALDNYQIGSYISSQIMAVVFIEKLLKKHFNEYENGLSLDEFLKICKENKILKEDLINNIDEARKTKNSYTHKLNIQKDYSDILLSELIVGITSDSKKALKTLKLCKKLYKEIKVTE